MPYLVTRDSLTATGQLPKFSDESYLSERDDLWLIPHRRGPPHESASRRAAGGRSSPAQVHGVHPLLPP